MMMGGMGYGMLLGSLLFACLILGYALLLWIFASKENGWVKTTGQVLAVIIAIIVVIMFSYGSLYKGMGNKGYGMSGMNKGMHEGMMGKGMMEKGMHGKITDKVKK